MADHLQHGAPFGRWRRHVAIAVWTGLGVITLVLVWRRAAGAFSVELTSLPACTFSTLAAVVGVVAWMLFASDERASRGPIERIGPVAATLMPPLLVGIALFPGGSSSTAAWLTVLLLLTAASLAVLAQWLPAAPRGTKLPAGGFADAAAQPLARPAGSTATAQGPLTEALSNPASNGSVGAHGTAAPSAVSQWFRRETPAGGAEQIEGASRVSFAAGQKHTAVHLAFTPPLGGVPEIECEPLDSADVELTVAAAYPYGARIEARRTGPLDVPLDVEIGFAAWVPPSVTEDAVPAAV